MIDYLGERKAVYYAARRFYAPVLLSLLRDGDGLEVHLTNDLLTPISGQLVLRLIHLDGSVIQRETEPLSLAANRTARVAGVDLAELPADPRDVFVHVSLDSENGQPPAENTAFLVEPKDLNLRDPQLQAAIVETDRGRAVRLEAARFAAYVWLFAPGLEPLEWADNFFHLLPGQPRIVPIHGEMRPGAEALREHVRIRTLSGHARSNTERIL
jgi:beta-mannosidase